MSSVSCCHRGLARTAETSLCCPPDGNVRQEKHILQEIPRDRSFDSTFSLLREGYSFIGGRCRQLQSDIFRSRPMLRDVVCLHRTVDGGRGELGAAGGHIQGTLSSPPCGMATARADRGCAEIVQLLAETAFQWTSTLMAVLDKDPMILSDMVQNAGHFRPQTWWTLRRRIRLKAELARTFYFLTSDRPWMRSALP